MPDQPTNSAQTTGQEFVSATVHLAGAVEVETGHVAHYSAEHIQARIGGVLIYFLDLAAVTAFSAAVADTERVAVGAFEHPEATGLPQHLHHTGQSVSLVVRLRGTQDTEPAKGQTAFASHDGHPFVGCKVGGLRLVIRDAEAMHRLSHVTATVARLAAALWPVSETTDDDATDKATAQDARPTGRQFAL